MRLDIARILKFFFALIMGGEVSSSITIVRH
jgi:hypothetical protein